jgi:hypothetical protein
MLKEEKTMKQLIKDLEHLSYLEDENCKYIMVKIKDLDSAILEQEMKSGLLSGDPKEGEYYFIWEDKAAEGAAPPTKFLFNMEYLWTSKDKNVIDFLERIKKEMDVPNLSDLTFKKKLPYIIFVWNYRPEYKPECKDLSTEVMGGDEAEKKKIKDLIPKINQLIQKLKESDSQSVNNTNDESDLDTKNAGAVNNTKNELDFVVIEAGLDENNNLLLEFEMEPVFRSISKDFQKYLKDVFQFYIDLKKAYREYKKLLPKSNIGHKENSILELKSKFEDFLKKFREEKDIIGMFSCEKARNKFRIGMYIILITIIFR